MADTTLDDLIRNYARGGEQYRGLRLRIAEAITTSNGAVAPLSTFLGRKLFDLKNGIWVNLSLSDKDWPFIARMRGHDNHRLARSYLNLTLSYISANSARIRDIYAIEAHMSRLLLSTGPQEADSRWTTLDKKDRQSLFACRLACALHHTKKDDLVAVFSSPNFSVWFRKRFLYPFIYYFINRPADESLEHHLSYVLPPGYENSQEKAVIRFLLKDDVSYSEPLAFKCYIALTTHPYDACEILLNHFESQHVRTGVLSDADQHALGILSTVVPLSRKEHLPGLFGRQDVLETLRDGVESVEGNCFPQTEFGRTLAGLLGSSVSEEPALSPENVFLRAACRLRATHYPSVKDYEAATSFARAYWFTAAGRLLGAYITSLYLLPRREKEYELREVFRLAGYLGGMTPFLATAPRAHQYLSKVFRGTNTETLMRHGALLQTGDVERPDRLWLNQIHLELSVLEQAGHFKQWLQKVFDRIPVMPAYLTGIDWAWFANMLRLVRIGPFLDSPAGIYTLLLQQVEGRKKDPNSLRIAMEPAARRTGNVETFLQWCIDSFGQRTVPLVVYFLTPNMLLWLRLENNFLTALGSRMRSVERCARVFGFGSILSEDALKQEERTYTAALLAINIGANQFEISWDILEKDISLAQGDVFGAYLALSSDEDSTPLLTLARQTTDHQFAIGRREKYVIVNRDWPLLSVVIGILETFMEHPTQGIESLLAIRIRHNALRKEYQAAVSGVGRANIANVSGSDRQYVVPQFEATVGKVVQDWIDKYMHQRRARDSAAVFDFVPTQPELEFLLESCRGQPSFGAVFNKVSAWIRERLDSQLQVARDLLSRELRGALESTIEARVHELQTLEPSIHSIRHIGKALVASLNQQTDRLVEWFQMPTATGTSVSTHDLYLAVMKRFESEIDRNALLLDVPSGDEGPLIPKEKVRMVYDLWCEAVQNALKHSGLERVRIRVTNVKVSQFHGLLLSSTRNGTELRTEEVAGHPFTSIHEALFRDEKSGLAKISCLSASIAGYEVRIKATWRIGFFHLLVPIAPLSIDSCL